MFLQNAIIHKLLDTAKELIFEKQNKPLRVSTINKTVLFKIDEQGKYKIVKVLLPNVFAGFYVATFLKPHRGRNVKMIKVKHQNNEFILISNDCKITK